MTGQFGNDAQERGRIVALEAEVQQLRSALGLALESRGSAESALSALQRRCEELSEAMSELLDFAGYLSDRTDGTQSADLSRAVEGARTILLTKPGEKTNA